MIEPFFLLAVLWPAPQADESARRPKPLETEKSVPAVKFFSPGFEVREIPVALTNINNVEYADDGRLFAAGYDGRLHLLRGNRTDGLEEQVTTFYDRTSEDYPLGMAVRPEGLYVVRRYAVVRHRDTKGDGVPDAQEEVASGWRSGEVDQDPLMTHRRIDDAIGLAIAPDGTIYVSMGAANYSNGYLRNKEGLATIDLKKKRGCVLRISPGAKNPEIVATGVRFLVCLQFNRQGDLFATDQEGATWLPNGNPFDELLHVEPGRHYGFPPRHPRHLPQVLDEPSVFDYAPQHQSTCGFRFNERRPGREAFGPASWEGDALVTGESRGKLFRTQLVKTAAGYVARNQLLATFSMLPVDLAISTQGDLVVTCHGGAPDWGSGPKGMGKLFKISFKNRECPQALFAYPAGPGETAIVFDRPLDPAQWKDLVRKCSMEGGAYVSPGDRFERFRPGYQAVKDQMSAPRWEFPILSAGLSPDARSILLRTAGREEAFNYALSLSHSPWGEAELGFDLTGVEARWTAADGRERWTGWLPHFDLAAARGLTRGSADHDQLWALMEKPGRLHLKGQLDLKQMLQPSIQPGSALDFEYPPEKVTLQVRSSMALRSESGPFEIAAEKDRELRLVTSPTAAWIPVHFSVVTGTGTRLEVSWHTDEDPRPRALPLRRILMPWARPPGLAAGPPRRRTELEGGRWEEGKSLFFGDRTACGKCHVIRGEGGKIGPDLSNLVQRDYESVMKDIVQPSAAINPDHIAYTIKLKNGDVLGGVIVRSTAESVVLGVVSGDEVEVPRGKIERMEPSKLSLMPENLLSGLSPEQIRDLMTFLLTPPR
jgi:putative heme-binding domain-containing protein